jgi:hypothetical protein
MIIVLIHLLDILILVFQIVQPIITSNLEIVKNVMKLALIV